MDINEAVQVEINDIKNFKEDVFSCISTFESSFFCYTCRIGFIDLYEHNTDKNNKKCVQMSCTAYIVYTFHITLHHANFGQFKAKQVL